MTQRWPRGPIVFLIDVSSGLERDLVESWINDNAADRAHRVVAIPGTRRRRPGYRGDRSALEREIGREDDPLFVPLRVAWFAAEAEDGTRRLRWTDLLTMGDPRDPGRLRQEWIIRRNPERARVVVAEPATESQLRAEWLEESASRPGDPAEFAEWVVLKASLALERAERLMRGNRYKVPRFVKEAITAERSYKRGVAELALSEGRDVVEVRQEADGYLDEIAAFHSPFVIDVLAGLIRLLYTQGYASRIHYDAKAIAQVTELSQAHPIAFLPSHRSNLDHLVLIYLLYENGLPPNHTAGGINMNFFPVGPLIRRAGVFFIRRSFKDNEVYKYSLKSYIDYLLRKRFPLEWFIEGGRSRTGKLRPPRYGMLAYVVDSWRRGSAEDVPLVPVSIAYDQIQDVGSYAAEQRGGAKERESFSWMVKALRTMRRRYGRIYVRFGEPISVAQALGPNGWAQSDDPQLEVQKLAFEVAVRINRATPITPISLVTLVLLSNGETALTVDEVMGRLEHYLEYVKRRSLPVTEPLSLDTPERVRAALDALVEHKVVSRFAEGPEVVYSIGPEQHLAAAYYRNTIIHFFVEGAIAEVALAAASDAADPVAAFDDAVMELRDLFKFEFFFPPKSEYHDLVVEEVEYHHPDWRSRLAGGRSGVLEVLRSFNPFTSPAVLRPFVEAYLVVADALVLSEGPVERKALAKACLGLGKQYLLQGTIRSPESVSTVLFDAGIDLADNRGLLDGEENARRAFAEELREVVRRIDVVGALAANRRAGLLD